MAQVEGESVEQFSSSNRIPATFVGYSVAEEVISATKADMRYGGDKAFYQSEGDFIQLPPKPSFHTALPHGFS